MVKLINYCKQGNVMENDSVINPWEVKGIVDYDELMKNFGIHRFLPTKKMASNTLFRRNVVYGQREFDRIDQAIKSKKKFVMMTGLMPSGKFHFGHKLIADQIIFYQSLGAKIYICVADVEAYNTRLVDLEQLRNIAIEEYLTNYIALGLDPKNCDFYFQSNRSSDADKSNKYYKLASLAARHVTQNEISAIYGELSPAKLASSLLQFSDMVHPQLIEGPCPTIVPIGFDQDPHVRLARDIIQRMKIFPFVQLSSSYHKFLIGLKGGKMSSSDETSYVALTDSPEEAANKIKKHAFSGGGKSLEEHRKHGGNPDIDVCFQWLYSFLEPEDKKMKQIEEDYRSGKMLTGELKQYTIELLTKFLERHHKKRIQAKNKIQKFLKN